MNPGAASRQPSKTVDRHSPLPGTVLSAALSIADQPDHFSSRRLDPTTHAGARWIMRQDDHQLLRPDSYSNSLVQTLFVV